MVSLFLSCTLTFLRLQDPFGYDKNDLNMDYFTYVIIRKPPFFSSETNVSRFPLGNELRAITATPAPDPSVWAFSNYNDHIFPTSPHESEDSSNHTSPHVWMSRGLDSMQNALHF